MMRRSAMALARKDMIDMLLRRGRLLDIQMLNFFNGQLERELGAASATSAPAAAAEAPSAAAADDRIATVDDRIAAVAAVEKQRLYDDFHAQCDRVRALARDSGDALSWMAEAHGVKEWATPHVAYKHLKATPDAVDPRKITLVGVAAATVEDDLHALFTFVEKERARAGASGSAAATLTDVDDPIFILCVSRYVSELFANIAVLYRTTAALTVDEAGKGHREWLLAQSFSASSQARRRKFLTDYRLMQAAAKAIGTKENYATHPVELMNVAPRGKEQRQKSSGKKASATAAAGEKA